MQDAFVFQWGYVPSRGACRVMHRDWRPEIVSGRLSANALRADARTPLPRRNIRLQRAPPTLTHYAPRPPRRVFLFFERRGPGCPNAARRRRGPRASRRAQASVARLLPVPWSLASSVPWPLASSVPRSLASSVPWSLAKLAQRAAGEAPRAAPRSAAARRSSPPSRTHHCTTCQCVRGMATFVRPRARSAFRESRSIRRAAPGARGCARRRPRAARRRRANRRPASRAPGPSSAARTRALRLSGKGAGLRSTRRRSR